MRIHLVAILIMFAAFTTGILAQQTKPRASFTFNNFIGDDQIGHIQPKLIDVSFCEDRFGNPNHAIHIFGNEFSYVNLGNAKVLKPRIGSISLWVKLEREVQTGVGYKVNPILLTKNESTDDFFEAYGIYYHLENKKLNASCARDSLRQTGIIAREKFTLYEWHHLAIAYDDSYFAFYIDGELQRKAPKNFETTFLEKDSVLLGLSANKKNSRYMEGAIDDIQFYDSVLDEKDIKGIYNAPNPNQRAVIIQRFFFILLILIFFIIFYFVVRHRMRLTAKKERIRLEMKNMVLETELRVNRALMNPHFVFNSLNTIQNFILKNENERANNYLVKFAKLMRKILESNLSDQISLEMEVDILNRYLEIEDLRFEENIKHEIKINKEINSQNIHIPVMMLQPFVENSIWHGLLQK